MNIPAFAFHVPGCREYVGLIFALVITFCLYSYSLELSNTDTVDEPRTTIWVPNKNGR